MDDIELKTIQERLLQDYHLFIVKKVMESASKHINVLVRVPSGSNYEMIDMICHALNGKKANIRGALSDTAKAICDEIGIPNELVDIYGVRKYLRLNP